MAKKVDPVEQMYPSAQFPDRNAAQKAYVAIQGFISMGATPSQETIQAQYDKFANAGKPPVAQGSMADSQPTDDPNYVSDEELKQINTVLIDQGRYK